LRRISRCDAIIADADDPKTALYAEDVALRVERNLARLIGAELPARHEHLHVHANHTGARYAAAGQPVQTAGVSISFEGFQGGDPGFEPGHRTAKPIDVEAEPVDPHP
jgi:hypothetical protein